MAEQEPRPVRIAAPHVVHEQIEIGEIILESVNEASLALGKAVSPQIDRLDREAAAIQLRGQRRVPPAMLVKTVNEDNDRRGVALGQPPPSIKTEAVAADGMQCFRIVGLYSGQHCQHVCHCWLVQQCRSTTGPSTAAQASIGTLQNHKAPFE